MKRHVEFKGFEANDRIKKLIDRLTTKLEGNLQRFSLELIHSRVMVEHNSTRSLYAISMTMDLPGNTLAAKEEHHEVEIGLKRVFLEIDRQLEKYKSSLRRDHWKRPERRQQVRKMKAVAAAAVAEEDKRELFFSMVTPQLRRLQRFVAHLIAYSEGMGDLPAGDLTPQDIVDGAIVRGFREFLKERSIPDVKNWLIRLAVDQLDAEVARLSAELAETAHIEEDVPETPPSEEVSTLGDEILDFYQPDEDLKLEDLIPDIEAQTPEDEVAARELRVAVARTLREMPRKWRRTLLLSVDGLSQKEIGKRTGTPEEEIDRSLRSAREFLRHTLDDSGFHFELAKSGPNEVKRRA